MSKSWMVMSRNRPPEAGEVADGGGSGSRLVMSHLLAACRSSPAVDRLADGAK